MVGARLLNYFYVDVGMCVYSPEVFDSHLFDIKPVKQVTILSSFSIQYLLSILLIGVALVTRSIVNFCHRY